MIMMRHSMNNNTRMRPVVSLCSNQNHLFDQFNSPELPQILDIGDLKQHDEFMRRRWSMARCLFKENHASLNTDII